MISLLATATILLNNPTSNIATPVDYTTVSATSNQEAFNPPRGGAPGKTRGGATR